MSFSTGDRVRIKNTEIYSQVFFGGGACTTGTIRDQYVGTNFYCVDFDGCEIPLTISGENLERINDCTNCTYRDRPGYADPCANCEGFGNWTEAAEKTGGEQKPAEDAEAGTVSRYRDNIGKLFDRQIQKGLDKYGVPLEENDTLTTEQRIEHLEEELADGMMYCECLKAAISKASMSADDYQRAALRTARTDEFSHDELLLNGVMGLCGEAGEVIDLIKKARYQGHELDKEDLILECGDVLWYVSLVAYSLGVSLSEVMEKNIEKLKDRFPDGFDKARSIHREENKSEAENF